MPATIIVRQGQQEKARIRLKSQEEVTALALLPPTRSPPVSILAVAFLDQQRQPMLGLYNAQTGKQVRQRGPCRRHSLAGLRPEP